MTRMADELMTKTRPKTGPAGPVSFVAVNVVNVAESHFQFGTDVRSIQSGSRSVLGACVFRAVAAASVAFELALARTSPILFTLGKKRKSRFTVQVIGYTPVTRRGMQVFRASLCSLMIRQSIRRISVLPSGVIAARNHDTSGERSADLPGTGR
jgi:hypothetical protein